MITLIICLHLLALAISVFLVVFTLINIPKRKIAIVKGLTIGLLALAFIFCLLLFGYYQQLGWTFLKWLTGTIGALISGVLVVELIRIKDNSPQKWMP